MTDKPYFNLPLLLDVVKWAEMSSENNDEPIPGWGRWEQQEWMEHQNDIVSEEFLAEDNWCGSSFCIAGQVAIQSGWRPFVQPIEDGYGQDRYFISTARVVKEGQGVTSVRNAAAQELGILFPETEALFSADNTIGDIKDIVNRLCESRGLPEPYQETL